MLNGMKSIHPKHISNCNRISANLYRNGYKPIFLGKYYTSFSSEEVFSSRLCSAVLSIYDKR